MPQADPRPLSSVSRPKQARSEQTLHRLLDAAEQLIQEKGLAGVSIPEIVSRAESSVGGFYARFKDKNELLRALEERFLHRLDEQVVELVDPGHWQRATTAEIVASCMNELVSTFRAEHNMISAFLVRAAAHVEIRDEGMRFQQRVESRMRDLLLTRRDEISHPEPEVAIDLAVQLAFGLMLQNAIFGELRAGDQVLDDAAIEAELVRNFLAYLGIC
ncbi:MAG: TetR/AcrR family transcriptional regulator [Myxococcota bacterium]|nr:TetR/AcrR family transcriptional regulator [Myxococcota bacterium]